MIEKEDLERLVNQRLSTYKIAEKLGKSRTSICYLLKKYNLKTCYYNKQPEKEELEKLVEMGLSTNKIADWTGRSQSNVRYWLGKYGLKTHYVTREKTDEIKLTHKTCNNCNENKSVNEFYFRKNRNKYYNTCKKCDSENHKKNHTGLNGYRHKNKQKLIDTIFSDCKCELCDFKTKNISVYDFHHRDPSKKEFNLCKVRYKMKECLEEIKKCILVCSNCHREIHGGLHPRYIEEKPILSDKPEFGYKVCRGCDKNLSLNNYYNLWNKCILCKKHMAQKRALKIKQQCLDYKGGKCSHCGYKKYIGAIDFHHVNSLEKEFRMSKLGSRDFGKKHKKELDKCIALCSNCHRIEHDRIRSSLKAGSNNKSVLDLDNEKLDLDNKKLNEKEELDLELNEEKEEGFGLKIEEVDFNECLFLIVDEWSYLSMYNWKNEFIYTNIANDEMSEDEDSVNDEKKFINI